MIKFVEGDLLKATENIIVHQVNCQGVMGSGLAKQIRSKYPIVYQEYVKLCSRFTDNKNLLGAVQMVKVSDGQVVVNLFGQYNYGREKMQYTDYEALSSGLLEIKNTAKRHQVSVALPQNIGCALGGGNWDIVYKMIESIFYDYNVTIYKLEASK